MYNTITERYNIYNAQTELIGMYIKLENIMNTLKNLQVSEIRSISSEAEYEDKEISVYTTEGEEYLFTMYRDNATGEIVDGYVKYAASRASDLQDAENVPDDVLAAFSAIKPEIISQLSK